VLAKNIALNVNRLDAVTASAKVLDLTGSTIEGLTLSTWDASSLDLKSDAITLIKLGTGTALLNWQGILFDGTLETKISPATLSGGATLNKIIVNNQLTLSKSNTFKEFVTNTGA
jgi:hypothetical protein